VPEAGDAAPDGGSDGQGPPGAFGLVVDSNKSGAGSNVSMHPMAVLGAYQYFFAEDGVHGAELWRTDGTSAGTTLVADTLPGPLGQAGGEKVIVHKGAVYFTATDGNSGTELWRSDGTQAGTERLTDVSPDGPRLPFSSISALTSTSLGVVVVTDRTLYLWNGTALVDLADVSCGFGGQVLETSGKLIFFGCDAAAGSEPWVSDGTKAGTQLLADLQPGAGGDPGALTTVTNGVCILRGDRIWCTNGTAAGTELVYDGAGAPLTWLGVFGDGRAAFAAAGTSTKILVTDGSAAATSELASFSGKPGLRQTLGGKIYFELELSSFNKKRYVLDGTPGGSKEFTANMVPLFEGGGRVWATSSSGLDFVSSADLTTSTVVASLRSPLGLTSVVGGKLLFGCELQSETVGLEPCVLDTSTSKLSVVKDINLNTQNARIGSATPWNDGVIFTSTDPTTSRVTLALAKRSELTTLGTFSTLQGAFSDLEVEALPRLGNKLFFVAQGAQTSQAEPWVTDGTPAGTQRLAKVLASRASGGGAVAVGNLVYFTGSNGSSGDVLYRTDGTEAGTVPASNKRPFGALRVLGDSVMFATSDGTFYRTSPAGEAAITGPGFSVVSARTTATKAFLSKDKDLYAYDAATGLNKIATFPQPSFLVATTPTKAFIGASTGAPDNRYDLWVSDGSVAGTTKVEMGLVSSGNLLLAEESAYFTRCVSNDDCGLFISNGVPSAAVKLATTKRVFVTRDSIGPLSRAVSASGKTFLAVADAMGSIELWESDGTATGTKLRHDLGPTGFSSEPAPLVVSGNTLYFMANDYKVGRELWWSNL
jgi:ELWxxDGT repeat protein